MVLHKTALGILCVLSNSVSAFLNLNFKKRGNIMTYQQIFKDVKKYFAKANTSHFTREFAFQFNITGEGEGIFYAAYKNGVLEIEPYDYQDRDVIFEADGTTLKDIAAGKLEAIDAVKAGKLAIDGDHEAAKQLLYLVSTAKNSSPTKTKKTAAKAEDKPAEKKEPAKTTTAKKTAKPAAKKEAAPAAKKEASTAAKKEAKPAAKKTTKASTAKKK